jgi:dihydrofolate reductase
VGRIFSSFSTSLDGFIADPQGAVGPLFDWYVNGDVEVTPPGYPITFRMSEASAAYWHQNETEGVFVCGRRIFDHARGWGGVPPNNSPTFVVTHRPPPGDWPPVPDAPFTFVDSLESAIGAARELANGKDIGVAGADIAQQCLNLGFLDEVRMDLVPVLLHEGIPYLANITNDAARLDLVQTVEGRNVTHLRYRVTYA